MNRLYGVILTRSKFLKRFIVPFLSIPIILSLTIRIARAECPYGRLRVEIEGNTKTTDKTIIRLAELRGDCAPEGGINPKVVNQRLLNSHLFSRVDVSVETLPELTTVKITVKDKWSIIPIPVFYTSNEQTGGGLMVLETNLLGRKKMLMLGAATSNQGNRYEGIYIDDALWGSRWILILRPFFTDRTLFQYDDEDEVYAYNDNYALVFGILGYKVTEHIAPGAGLIYRYRHLTPEADYPAPPQEGHTNGAMVNLRINYANYTDYYDKGFTGTFTFEHTIQSFGADLDYGQIDSSVDFTWPVWFVLSRTLVGGRWSIGEHVQATTYPRIGGEPGNRGIPTFGLWVRDFLQVSQEAEEALYRHKLGTLTMAQFFDCVFTAEDDPLRAYPAVGAGLRVYLKEVAIPAVGVDLAYSLRNDALHVTAYVGKAF